MAPLARSITQRMHERSKREGDCLIWLGARFGDGYGAIGSHRHTWRVHVVAWEIANKRPVPLGSMICHTCDNPICIEPSHLFAGTSHDNTEDMWNKGRHKVMRGERHPNCKLTDEQVETIRKLRGEGRSLNSLASQFGVSFSRISYLYRNGRGVTEDTCR